MIAILLFIGAMLLLYSFIMKPYSYWSKKNVATGKMLPFIEDVLYKMVGRESMAGMVQRMYSKLTDARYVGTYQFNSPVLVLKSPELIKQICVKDFDHFLDHKQTLPSNDELWSNNLASLKGQHWKNMRSTLSPSFTSSKMKSMFILICENAQLFVDYFMEKREDVVEVEMKDAYSRFTIDVIASAAFGVQVDSLKDKENDFYMLGMDLSNFTSLRKTLTLLFYLVFPKLANFVRIPIFDKRLRQFFMNLVRDTIKMRKEQNIKRPDMLGLLIEAKNGGKKEKEADDIKEVSFAAVKEHFDLKTTMNLSDNDIASQVFIFFFAGFETVSTAMCFVAYELAVNPDIQRKLIVEIDENKERNALPTYETIVNMTYLDMVISESLRKWPIAVMTDRLVTKTYTIQPELPEEVPVQLEINDNVIIPIYALHHDPRYYENPEKFDPERFSPENRKSIDPYTYLPFGIGPRNCIGSRFALLEIKAVFFYLLSEFEIVPIEKTQIPLRMSKSAFNMMSENGFPLGLKKRC